MEFVKGKEMYLIVQDTEFNRKYHNYKLGDVCDCDKRHNQKYVNYRKAKRKLFKTQREKKLVFMESLHEEVRKSVNPELPSRLSSIILYDNKEDCLELAKRWSQNTGIVPLGLFKVECDGKLHACATTPDEQKPKELTKVAHIDGLTRFWVGDKNAEEHEYFFQGKAQIIEVLEI